MPRRRVPSDKRVRRRNPTKSGEKAGVAARLVTLLWPRKEKSLAPARRAGETPSRPAASRPARRSRAITFQPAKRLIPPLCTAKPCHHTTDPAANGIPRSGRLRLTANRPYDCTAQACLLATGTESGWTPGCHRQRGPGRPYRPKNASQSLNTGCNPACRTASATSPRARSSWMANCSSSSLSPSA